MVTYASNEADVKNKLPLRRHLQEQANEKSADFRLGPFKMITSTFFSTLHVVMMNPCLQAQNNAISQTGDRFK